jgi:uncharacterized protein YehS (DUF1456 family)
MGYASYEDELIAKIFELEQKLQGMEKEKQVELLNQNIQSEKLFNYLQKRTVGELKEVKYVDLFDVKTWLLQEKKCKNCQLPTLNCKTYTKIYSESILGRFQLRKVICVNYQEIYYTNIIKDRLENANDDSKLIKYINKKLQKSFRTTKEGFLEDFLHGTNIYQKAKIIELLEG